MSKPVRPFLGQSAESRVESRRRLLMDQAFALLADDRWRHTSIAALCRDLTLNKRYFYESFSGLDALEDAVVDELTASLLQLGLSSAGKAQQQGLDTDALARQVLGDCLAWLIEDPRRAQVLFAKASDNPRARQQRNRVIAQLARALASFGLAYHHPGHPELAVTDTHEQLAGLAASMLIGGTIESTLRWLDGEIALSLDQFVDDIAHLWVALASATVDMAVAR
ncbi:TetR/AcrR family transcriptional regulator [Isoalcanivorax indicus]|uniref:TetR/AcrR family transcriptional regulator n=1 Tax=Isoalcanivorax indicus TaxID=2202653 RepID=UPI000DB8F925|nr:hypothetical protein [Isoalcanivorax indicus]